jgi:hypothetical protein
MVLGVAGLIAILCAGCFAVVDAPNAQKTHRKSAVKKPPLPPLPSGPQGPVPQISLDSMQAVAPHVTYQDGQLTIVAPNSTLADILRAVHRLTGADVDIPTGTSERVVTNLGPGPAREVVSDLLNGSHFNYVLLGSPADANTLTRVVLVAKGGADTTAPNPNAVANGAPPQPAVAENAPDAADADSSDDSADDSDQNADADQQPAQAQPGAGQGDSAVKTPQQLLQEMQQRQLQMQQQQQGQTGGQPYPGPVVQPPGRQPQPQTPPDQQ